MYHPPFPPVKDLSTLIDSIILIDDDEDDLDLFADALESLKIPVTFKTFKNGEAFLDYLQNADTSNKLKVFLDLNMPIISGIDVLKQVKSSTKTANIWITIYSTSSSPNDVEVTYSYGANSYLQKPTSFNDLKKYILKSLERYVDTETSISRDTFVINF